MNSSTNTSESFAANFAGWAFVIFIVVAFIGAAIFFVIHGSRTLLAVTATQSWPQTDGRITQSEVVLERAAQSDSDHWWNLEYAYSVDGQAHRSSRYAIGYGTGRQHRFSLQSGSYDLAATAYDVGDKVTVYYDPQHQAVAVLSRRIPWLSVVELIIGLLLSGATLMIVWKSLAGKSSETT